MLSADSFQPLAKQVHCLIARLLSISTRHFVILNKMHNRQRDLGVTLICRFDYRQKTIVPNELTRQ